MIARARRAKRPARVERAPLRGLASTRRLLLDTQVWLWWVADDPRLGPGARDAIARANEVRFSAASVWEIEIKRSIGKLTLPDGYDIGGELREDGFDELEISIVHAGAAGALPLHHRDPFDRLLVAQALTEQLVLVTSDAHLARYAVPLLSATE